MTGWATVRLTMLLTGAAMIPAASASAATRSGTVRVGSQQRSFVIHVPDGAAPRGGFPVILAFHGGGMQGRGMQRITGLDAVADERRFIAVYPDGIGKHWNDGRSTITDPQQDVRFVGALLDQLERSQPVDRGRVFATGLSNGALFAQRLACDLSSRIAGIAPVAGPMPEDIAASCRPPRPVAVLQINGTADPIMPYRGGTVEDFGGRGEGGRVLSVADSAAFWARRNGCAARGAPEPLPQRSADRTRAVRMRYTACPEAAQVTQITLVGGGHVWPGGVQTARPLITGPMSRQIEASGAIADFFLSLPKR